MLAFLGYLVGTNLMIVGTQWISSGRTPAALGLWWLLVPLLVIAIWSYARDGRLSRPKQGRHEVHPANPRSVHRPGRHRHGAADLGGVARPGRGQRVLQRGQGHRPGQLQLRPCHCLRRLHRAPARVHAVPDRGSDRRVDGPGPARRHFRADRLARARVVAAAPEPVGGSGDGAAHRCHGDQRREPGALGAEPGRRAEGERAL